MTTTAARPTRFRDLVNAETGEIDRSIFTDEAIYQMELERIFARAWNFVAHESQVANPGDFYCSFIGEDRVICVRDKQGGLNVLLNTCRHRGNAVCRAEEGHASSFMCTYHGWTYDLKGQLVGVPGFKDYYHEDLDREHWGLVAAPHVESYKGFIFANLDPEAPGLDEYLGEVGKIGLSMLAERGEDLRVVSGVQKYTIGCNWKFAVDNNFDWAHVNVTHSSAIMARPYNRLASNQGGTPQAAVGAPGLDRQDMTSIFGEYGHAIGGPAYVDEPTGAHAWWRDRREARKALGPVGMKSAGHPNIFPNAWVACNSNQLIVRMPKGPHKTEMWMYVLIDHSLKEREPDRWERLRFGSIHGHGPAGMFEMEDGENWDQSTRGMSGAGASKYPLNFAMNLGRGQVVDEEGGPPYVQSKVNEHPQLWVWRCWADWMDAESWAELKANHTLIPDVV